MFCTGSNAPEIDAYLRCLLGELSRLEQLEAAVLTVAIMRQLAEHLRDLGVAIEVSPTSTSD